MKRTVYSIAIGAMALILTAATAAGQGTQPTAEQQKQKEFEMQKQKEADMQKKLKTLSEEEQQKLKQSEMDAKKREYELRMKIAELEGDAEKIEKEFEWQHIYLDDIQKDLKGVPPVMVVPDGRILRYGLPYEGDYFVYGNSGHASKPGSSWNYSRQVMEATFTNEFTMSASDESSVNLSVSGDCAEGSMTVAIIMPDGKQLSEVVLDENGSLNWRKSFEADEDNGWKNGKWVFKIRAKNATGNLRISLNSN